MALNLTNAKLCDHFAFKKDAPRVAKYPRVWDAASLQFFFVRFFLIGILLFKYFQLTRAAWWIYSNKLTQKQAE
ncbi:hypothetical protein BraRD5C2_55480 [Bradyrhizobium sp. RD5-C2]|nr:hypothetical protein BraRD5C2_55480 [Bradyrhizobium sp. RD5-C2]